MDAVGTHTVVALFNSHQDAQDAIRDLVDAGVNREDLSLVAKNRPGGGTPELKGKEKSTGLGENVAGGAIFGGLGGLLIGLGALAIPGIGPVVAAGPLATTLAGAGIGALGGGIIGGIKEAGVPDEDAGVFAESIRRGDILLSVRTDANMADRVANIMNDHGALDVDERANEYRSSGWTGFNQNYVDDIETYDYSMGRGGEPRKVDTSRPRARTYQSVRSPSS
jgi:uncharacterized membrane protein